ncbi:MAG: DUF2589 domain-containing protein [Polyangiaceae bacterium]
MNGIQAMNSIPFDKLIGGPLSAAVNAQGQAAMTCIQFIEAVGFQAGASPGDPKEAVNVEFTYSKSNEDGDPATFKLTVPMLAIVPIPYLRIDEVLIDFSAKLTDMVSTDQTTAFTGNLSFSAGWGPVKFRGSASYKNDKSTKTSSTQDYSMSVKVRAVQAEIPGGMAKVLDMLEAAVRDELAA